ncbi:MAG: hypothetical protein CVV62_02745, partial [Tenericutes bacterium HGW-Tenericutes-7]
MKYMTSAEIRQTWLDFFKSKGHKIEPSASLVPQNDPTLLWINAGVAPLKKYFDGRVVPKNPRIVNVQKCIRTNDIENVGNTARHHTFFEMMGNFSIGDYFRDEAIEYGFEILTSDEYFGFPIEKLYFTYYPTDLETKQRWLDLGISEEHLISSKNSFVFYYHIQKTHSHKSLAFPLMGFVFYYESHIVAMKIECKFNIYNRNLTQFVKYLYN